MTALAEQLVMDVQVMDAASIGRRLRELRTRAGLTREELAAAAGVPMRSLEGWEQGRREPLASVLFDLAAALQVSVAEFAEPEPPAKPKRGRPRKSGDE